MVTDAKVDRSTSSSRYRVHAPAKSELPAGCTTTNRPQHRRVGPEGVNRVVGEPEIGGEVAEEIEGQRRRPQQVGPQPLVIEALLAFDERRSCSRGGERVGGEEVGAGFSAVVEWKAASDEAHVLVGGARCDRLRTDRVPMRLTPLRLVVAKPATELGHLRPPRHAVLGLPAVRGLEFLLGGNLGHVVIVWSDPPRTSARRGIGSGLVLVVGAGNVLVRSKRRADGAPAI